MGAAWVRGDLIVGRVGTRTVHMDVGPGSKDEGAQGCGCLGLVVQV